MEAMTFKVNLLVILTFFGNAGLMCCEETEIVTDVKGSTTSFTHFWESTGLW
jgi:hypothetical protein